MQPFPIPFEPTNLTPCLTLRARKEANTKDSVNSRFVEHWQTDAPAVQYSRRDVSGAIFWLDMNATPSRLYREDLRQSQPFVVPSAGSSEVKQTIQLNDKINQSLSTIQSYERNVRANPSNKEYKEILSKEEEKYKLYLTEQKQISIDSLSENPYFNKYDVAGDSRNVIRELRGVVTEDVVDRGVRESQRLLRRELDNRWLPANYAKDAGIDQLSAFELMRPKMNNMGNMYK
jgi:hypothetical protein